VLKKAVFGLWLAVVFAATATAQYPTPVEGDFVISNFRFTSGETLPQLRLHEAAIAASMKTDDANDLLYQIEAWHDYNPGPDLEKIRAPLFAVNSADDLVNPPELGILDREIKRVPKGRAVVVPMSPETPGHGTHTIAAVWKQYLAELLSISGH
jgi:pimeloyl-ACP methyl ester carboxylesterase